MKTKPIPILAILLLISITIFSCDSGFNPECDGSSPTYLTEIKPIIEANCNSASCHGTNSNRGDWTSYALLESVLTNGKFESEVLVKQSMPPAGPLSETTLNLIKCWAETGFPEN